MVLPLLSTVLRFAFFFSSRRAITRSLEKFGVQREFSSDFRRSGRSGPLGTPLLKITSAPSDVVRLSRVAKRVGKRSVVITDQKAYERAPEIKQSLLRTVAMISEYLHRARHGLIIPIRDS